MSASEQSNNYLVKLYKGDVPLVKTFWVFHIIIGTVLTIVCIALAIVMPVVYFILLMVQAYLMIALWNSASKYQGAAIWRILAKINAVIGLIVVVSSVVLLSLGLLGVIGPPGDGVVIIESIDYGESIEYGEPLEFSEYGEPSD